ncbi:GH17274 [Drosophila grimshawi]|uniref:GH17274 n=1 Tax=Drosophila grimshawi TaxID=7222 RepID=B4JUE7_DROGR|nr:GH17274 [Drosophila grimshawi]
MSKIKYHLIQTEVTLFGPNILDNYFVYTSHCRMPALNPFTKDVLKIFKKMQYATCDRSKVLLSVDYDDRIGRYKFHINDTNIKCCYRKVQRNGKGARADNDYKLASCEYFEQDSLVPQDVDAAVTECRRLKEKSLLQHAAFGFVQPKEQLMNNSFANDSLESESFESRPSVLLWGIDSMSRMNFERTMPLMFKYLREENWFELRGYNKMGDNTFPNLMALLTGFNSTRSYSVCRPTAVGGMDACPLMWKDYKKHGYVTAYAEDWGKFATFNYNKKGFAKPPTDYYPRPLMLAAEKELKKVVVSNIPYCLGHRHYAEYIYDFAIQFTKVYRNQSTFGMFWTNSFSHNNFMLPSSMDTKMLEYMRTLSESGVLEKSIVIFFSDHGMRFGPLRRLDSGFLEERMPIIYIWLPQWFKDKYPVFVHNLHSNRNRLTSPYDIYATLKHILQLETPLAELPRPEGCPSCHSLFHEVAETRDCNDTGISAHWCTCHTFKYNSKSDNHIKEVAQQLIDATNDYLKSNNLTKLCQTLKLSNIESVQRKIGHEVKEYESYLIRYEAEPENAIFEASASWHNNTRKMSIHVPDISRLDSYRKISECIEDNIAKKFCICFPETLRRH